MTFQAPTRRAGDAKTGLAAPPRHELALQHWLFAGLRFAITLKAADRSIVLALAAEMDRAGSASGRGSFAFFVRTSAQLCDALTAPDRPENAATLRVFLNRIDHLPLRRAFEAAVFDLKPSKPARREPSRSSRDYLWKGLPAREAPGATRPTGAPSPGNVK